MLEQNKNENNIQQIHLDFPNAFSVLSGRPSGIICYEQQMKSKLQECLVNIDTKIQLLFPEHIKLISGSYLLGMFEEINNQIGIEGIKERFVLESSTEDALLQMLLDELIRSDC